MSGKTIRPGLLRGIRAVCPGVCLVNIFWDNPFFYDVAFSGVSEYDRFFVKDTYVVEEMKKLGFHNVRYMHHACYPGEHRPLADLTLEEQARYGSALSFVGSMYPYRARILDVFRDMDLKIWGGLPRGSMPSDSVAYTKHQGERVWGRRKQAVFSASAINLNTQNYQNDIFSVSSKVHQLAASRAFQLIDAKHDLDRLYRVGEEVIVFHSREELRELAKYYLAHPKQRTAISERAQKRALADHTYAHRWQALLKAIDG
jgi:spore maturation protein CgeB